MRTSLYPAGCPSLLSFPFMFSVHSSPFPCILLLGAHAVAAARLSKGKPRPAFGADGKGVLSMILQIKGKVKFTITLDPGVWIFDDRRVDLLTYFDKNEPIFSKEEEEEKKTAKYWEREIQEGSVSPPTLKTERKFEKMKVLTGTFGIPFRPFLNNAEPLPEAKAVTVQSKDGDVTVSLDQAMEFILGFSKEGKPLREDGPVHVYFGDGSNRDRPIKNVTGFIVE